MILKSKHHSPELLTPREKAAVETLLAAVEALPRSICIKVNDNFHGDGHFHVLKRTEPGCACTVAAIRKASLDF